nr:hypothetical protein [Bacillus atrophaeus]
MVENDYYEEEFLNKHTFNQMKYKKHTVTNSDPHPS